MPDGTKQPALLRAIGLPRATAMVAGTIIGASIFVQPSEISALVPSPSGVVLAWVTCGLLTLFGALVCAELASIFTETGGVYVFLREAFSPLLGFLWGWGMFWVMHSGIIAAMAVVFARYTAYFFPLSALQTRWVAVAIIIVLTAVNYFGVSYGSGVQMLFTLGKLAAIASIIVLGLWMGRQEGSLPVAETISESFTAGDFALALIAGLFAFGGWHMVTYNSEETKTPEKTIPRALIFGTLIVMACYIGLNTVYFYVLPFEVVVSSTRVAADFANRLLGFGGGAFMSALVMLSTFGALSGIVLAGPRVYYSMARDGLLFSWAGAVHPRFRTPHRAILLQGAWSSVLAITGTYRELFSRVIYTEWIFFGLLAVALIILRRRADRLPAYRIRGYPATPLIFAGAAFCIVANHIFAEPAESALGLGLVLSGIPVYYFWGRQHYRRPSEL